jgi:hypothetical protein
MAIGWRMTEDLETLADLPDGSIDIDLRNGSATHSTAGQINLWIAKEMQAWLKQRFAADHISEQQISRAELRLNSKTDRIKTDRKRIVSFDWECHSLIATDQKTYESHLTEVHRWHNRL